MGTDPKPPISASLARRLAEAADGFRNTGEVFFIAGYARPHPIKEFPDFNSAKDFFDNNNLNESEFGIFGPYKTIDDLKDSNLIGVENIKSVELIIHFDNSETQNISLPGKIDSIFFNLSSLEKFLLPYYTGLFGVDYAKQIRDNALAQFKAAPAGKVAPVSHVTKTLAYRLSSVSEDIEDKPEKQE